MTESMPAGTGKSNDVLDLVAQSGESGLIVTVDGATRFVSAAHETGLKTRRQHLV
jgi:hypothetical protein